jgi:putative MFS transporter
MLTVVSCSVTVAYFGFGTWLPSLLAARGVEVAKSLAYTAVIGLSYPLAPLLFSFFADRVERKWQIVAGAGLVSASGLLFAAQSSAAGWLSFGLLVAIGGHLTSCATHTYRSELFPAPVRGRAIGFVYAIDRLAAAFNSYVVGFILIAVGSSGVLLFIACMALIAMLAAAWAGPKVRGLATEEIQGAGQQRA